MTNPTAWHTPFQEFEEGLSSSETPFFLGMAQGSMTVELFKPVGVDAQQPHAQDELYIILSGTSGFKRDGESVQVAEGDVLFVPAGMDHRFVNFSDDFQTWVVFWGPKGGETHAD